MKMQYVLIGIALAGSVLSCNVITDPDPSVEDHRAVEYQPVVLDRTNLNPLSFGTSAKKTSRILMNGDGTISLKATEDSTAGKIAGSEDGITFYFKEVQGDKNFRLTAKIQVESFGFTGTRTDLNGQEGFGLMARDYVPQYPGKTMADLQGVNQDSETYYAGSTGGTGNMILVGGVKRGVRVYWRTGVTDPSGGECITNENVIADASKAVFTYQPREMPDYSKYHTADESTDPGKIQNIKNHPDFPSPGSIWNLSLEKTNNGFEAVITPPANKGVTEEGEEKLGNKLTYSIPEPDLLFSIDKDHYYVGFFVARDAEMRVLEWNYFEANAADCPPRVEAEPELITPAFKITSLDKVSEGTYTLHAQSNVEGVLTGTLNGAALKTYTGVWTLEKTNASAVPFMDFQVPAEGLHPGDNVFSLSFVPAKNQSQSKYTLKNREPLQQTFIVNRKTLGEADGTIWVSPGGHRKNQGTYQSPVDLDTGIAYIQPGKTLKLQKGTYTPLTVHIPRYNNGTEDNPKTLEAEERDQVFLDFNKNPQAKGFLLEGDYWIIRGIHVRHTPDKTKGFTIGGSHNIVEWVKIYRNGDTGLQISGNSKEPKSLWPSYNTIQYSESFSNRDEAEMNADGFSSKLTSGEGNRFKWCISHHNIDDGWDLFSKKETGPTGAVVLEHCISYKNGRTLEHDEIPITGIGGNGFKMGGEGLSVFHEAQDCIAFWNAGDGFTSNSNPALRLTRCTAFDNGDGQNNISIYGSGSSATPDARVTQILSLYSGGTHSKDRIDNGIFANPAAGYRWDGTETKNTSGRTLTAAENLISLVPPFTASGTAPFDPSLRGRFLDRLPDGRFDLKDFLKVKDIIGSTPGATGLW